MSHRDPSEEKIVETFLVEEGIEEEKKLKILDIIKRIGNSFLGASYFISYRLTDH